MIHRLSSLRIPLFLLCFLLPLLLSVSQSNAEIETPHEILETHIPNETPTVMVEEGVSSYTVAYPRLLWHTNSNCQGGPNLTAERQAAAPEDPELISRMFVSGGDIRVLLEKNDPRPPAECNPYKIHSNLVGDDDYVYWADDTGLVRQSTQANANDEPELVSSAIKSTHNSNQVLLAITDDYVYAIIYTSVVSSRLHRIDKTTLAAVPHLGIVGYPTQLKADDDYAFWLFSGELWQAEYITNTGWDAASIATGATSFASTTFYVYIARGDEVVRYNKVSGTTGTPFYTSASPDSPNIYSMEADSFNVYFLESRANLPCPQCLFEYTQVLFRLPAVGGTAAPLYTRVSPFSGLNVGTLQQGDDYLYWQEDGTIRKLAKDAAALPQTNIIINRMEVTQGIQTSTNTVSLIGGRRTFVRVFAMGQGAEVYGVTAWLYRIDPNTLQPIGEPLVPMNSTGGTHNTIHSLTLPILLDNSFVFELPLSWVQTGTPLRLKAVVNPYNTPLESNPNDNTVFSPTFTPIASARLEAEFYALGYNFTLSGTTHFPRHIEDIDQTFSYIRRTYPLASAPGGGTDSSVGFRPNVHWVFFNRLEALLNQSDPYCADFDPGDPNDPDKPNERVSCASTFVLDTLRSWQDRDEDADGTAYIYYGWMPDRGGFGRGLGGGGAATGPTGADDFGWDFDGAYTDWYTAHEFAHAIGREHPSKGNECDHSADDDDFPYTDSAIGPYNGDGSELGLVWGFDFGDSLLGLPRQPIASSIWRDFMGYCNFQWISDYTYNGLYDDIPDWVDGVRKPSNGRVAAPSADMLAIYGSILPDTGVAKLTVIERTSFNTVPPLVAGEFAIRLLNSQGQVLANHAFTPNDPEDHAQWTFGQAVPFVAGTAKIQIVQIGTEAVWGEATVSSNVPVVSNVAVVAGTNPVTGTVTVNWTATDADGDELTADIFFSQDGGTTFSPYVLGVSGNSTAVDTNFLGGGSTIFRVIASDGVNMGQSDSAPFTLANKPPTPVIHNPGDGAVVSWGQLINFMGEAMDLQDGTVAADNLAWSNQDGPLGTGAVLAIDDLPVGLNEITLTATNSKGVSASTTITVIVEDNWQLPVADLQVGPNQVGWHVAAGEEALQATVVHLVNIGIGNLSWTASENAEWLTLNQYSGSADTTVTFVANPSGLEADRNYTADVTFAYTDGNGQSKTITIPVSLSIGDVRNNPPHLLKTIRAYLPFIGR